MKIILKDVRLSFPNIYHARSMESGKEPKFDASFLFAPNSPMHELVRETIQKVAAEKWGAKATETLKQLHLTNKLCIHDGAVKGDKAGYAGNMYVSASAPATKRPIVVDGARRPIAEDSGKIYGGCYVNAQIDIWAQDDAQWGKRVNAQLLAVQFAKDGEPFGGGARGNADEFDLLEQPAGSADDGIPF